MGVHLLDPIQGVTTGLRIGVIATLLLIIAIYHGTGIHFVYWADSAGYLSQGLSIGSPNGYQRYDGRGIGYPLLLAVLARIPFTALAIVAAQVLLVIAAYRVLFLYIVDATPAVSPRQDTVRTTFLAALPLALAATASYSALHVFVLSLLPEILFAVLVLFAVVAVARLVHMEKGGPGVWQRAGLTAALATLPVLVKPHWLLAAPALTSIVAAKIVSVIGHASKSRTSFATRTGLAVLLPFAAYGAVTWPERYLSATINPETSLFGPRTLFCNHMHMIDDTLNRYPDLVLSADPGIDHPVRQAMRELRARDDKPWKHLGFDGDLCSYDVNFQSLIARLLPTIEAQRQFFIGSYLVAVRAEPARFAGKLGWQIVLGLAKSFEKFSYHISIPLRDRLEPQFLAGTTDKGDAGPLGAQWRLKSTVIGWIVLIALGAIFIPLLVGYLALVAMSLVAAPIRWRTWSHERRRAFLAYIGVPLTALLAHHALVGISHSFDIWRYAFGVFFINLGFIATAGMFWLEEGALARASRHPTPVDP